MLVSGHADIVAFQHQTGAVALVWLDLSTGAVVTSHTGLRDMLRRGLQDWTGNVVHTQDGHAFLSLCMIISFSTDIVFIGSVSQG